MIVIVLIIPIVIGTGTEVKLNLVSLFISALLAIWLLVMIGKRELSMVRSRTFLPLFLLILAGAESLLIGNVPWDPFLPRPANFLLMQLAQSDYHPARPLSPHINNPIHHRLLTLDKTAICISTSGTFGLRQPSSISPCE